jgi:Holliday junction resolvase RusA-like endonuclease
LGNSTPPVKAWREEAAYLLKQQSIIGKCVKGKFTIVIMWDEAKFQTRDVDNPGKPVLDLLQSLRIVENDSLCWKLTVGWGLAPSGARIELSAVDVSAIYNSIQG